MILRSLQLTVHNGVHFCCVLLYFGFDCDGSLDLLRYLPGIGSVSLILESISIVFSIDFDELSNRYGNLNDLMSVNIKSMWNEYLEELTSEELI